MRGEFVTDFFDPFGEEIDAVAARLGSTKAMLSAIEHACDCELIYVFKRQRGGVQQEFIVCDITCDEIPSRNQFGIRYRERIAYCFGSDKRLPSTYAWRKTFPITMHQNCSHPGEPKSLCLYEESDDVTELRWTPQRHLQRTQWWLIQAAQGRLHAEEQAVEQLFYVPKTTIVIPHDLHAGLAKGKSVEVDILLPKVGGNEKVFLKVDWCNGGRVFGRKVNILEIMSPDITHGRIYSPATKFTDMAEQFDAMGVDIVQLIRERLVKFVESSQGNEDVKDTAFVVTLPIRRRDALAHEREQRIGFYCFRTVKDLLVDFDVKVVENGYLNKDASGALRPMGKGLPHYAIEPMEVLRTSPVAMRRAQSGYAGNLRNGVLVGAGALGGALLDIWVRGGWGSWTVVDEDVFKPHNLTRHVASSFGIGKNKAEYAQQCLNYHFPDTKVVGVNADACKWAAANTDGVFLPADLVVDASASLTYPREVSSLAHAPRHMSAFFAPGGNDAVLLVEDTRRKSRLSYLEAQYYRALIELPVGEKHFVPGLSTFRSGVSCRDISTVMSHARVLSLSSLLADQIRLANEVDEAQILIWQDNLETGERCLTNVGVRKARVIDDRFGSGFKVVLDEGVEEKVTRMRSEALPNETGGVLIGYFDIGRKWAYIVDAFPSPPDSVAEPTSFKRGEEGVEVSLLEAMVRTGQNAYYIGEWHSHPGRSATMSKLDRIQLDELEERMSSEGFPAFQLIVAEGEIKVHGKGGSRG